jgi:cytochrome P450
MPDPTPLAEVDPLDPFEEFNRAMGAGKVENPYPDFHRMREQHGPVAVGVVRGEVDPDIGVIASGPSFTPLTFDTTHQVLRDGETFSSAGYADVMGIVMGHTILEMDEPEHGTYRRLVQQAFTRKEMERWERELVIPIIDELIDGFIDDGSTELVSRLTFPFPVNVIAGLLGLPREDLPMFHRLAVELIGISIDWDRGIAASQSLREYLTGVLEERRAAPRDDVISVLAQAELEGKRLTDDEIFAFLRLLLPAGAETTYRSSSNLLCGLLRHPEQLDAVRDDRSLVPQAIEEGLRWEAPLLTILRTATRDVTLGGVDIAAGASIIVNLGAADHDPDRWDRPDDFDIFREPKQHLAFAFGPHMCLGMHLARMETHAVLNRVFDRLPGLRLDLDAPAPYITGLIFRAPPRLDVTWG